MRIKSDSDSQHGTVRFRTEIKTRFTGFSKLYLVVLVHILNCQGQKCSFSIQAQVV